MVLFWKWSFDEGLLSGTEGYIAINVQQGYIMRPEENEGSPPPPVHTRYTRSLGSNLPSFTQVS